MPTPSYQITFIFLIKIKDEEDIEDFQKRYKPTESEKELDYHKIVMNQFKRMLNGYAQAYNKQYDRKGALFVDYIKRKEINNEYYFSKLIHYIHNNPVHHNFCKSIDEWKFSSYHSVISNKPSLIERKEVLDWFGDTEYFIKFHAINTSELISEFEF